MLGQQWHHIGLMLSHFRAILWFVLAFVGQELAYLGPFWATLANFGPRWHHIGLMLSAILGSVSAFALDLVGHFSVVEFLSMQGVCKKHHKYHGKNTIFGLRCWWFLLLCFGCFCFFLLWHAALRLCLPDLGLMFGHCGLCRHHIGLMLSNFGVCCGLRWLLLGKSWDHIGLILGHLGYVGTFLATLALYLAHVEPF